MDEGLAYVNVMVLLHARRDEKGVYWFLLLNWWREMPLVEVSEHYFALCGATVFFAEQEIVFRNGLDPVYSKNSARIAHCHNLDRAPAKGFSFSYDYGLPRHRAA